MGYVGNAPYQGVVDTGNIADNSVTTSKIAPDTVVAADIAPGAVGASELASGAAVANIGYTPLNPANNLSEVTAATARTNLGLGTAATTNSTAYATAAQGTKADSALQPAAIGVTVQGYSASTVVDASYVHTDNNYTTAEKSKLAGIAAGAEVNVNADWTAASGDAQILNKPTLGTLSSLSPSGTASSSTFLRGDNSWQVVAVTPTAVSSQNNTATDYFDIPSGTTAQRPASPATGMIRYNTTNSEYEVYTGSEWKALTTQAAGSYVIEYLIVGGGGGGGRIVGGGGGAGGYIAGSTTISPSVAYSIVVGAGGSPQAAGALPAAGTGSNSSFYSLTAIGGGGGAGYNGNIGTYSGASGGSGGGAWAPNPGGSGTAGQGNSGGTGVANGSYYDETSGGGGGAGASGSSGNSSASGNGGAGTTWSNGTTYAGGGGGGAANGPGATKTAGSAGSGGGGAGGNPNGGSGSANTGGGGGGGAGHSTVGTPGTGGSGVVIIRYVGAQRGTGGTVTSSGGYTYHTFTTSGTYTS